MIFTKEFIHQTINHHYGMNGEITPLQGYDEQNFLLITPKGEKFVLKITAEEHGLDLLNAQVAILDYLGKKGGELIFPKILRNQAQQPVTHLNFEGKAYYFRVLTFLEGTFWVNAPEKKKQLYLDLGNFLGEMDKALQGFSHPATHRSYIWDISKAAEAKSKLAFIKDPENRRLANYFLLQFETEVAPVISSLRHACIHNDANDYNVLIKQSKVSGLIDFGDIVYTALINNLSVACTYAMLHTEDPLQVATWMVEGYHHGWPLTEMEIKTLYYLISARLCISVTQSAYNASLESGNEHHFLSEKSAWILLDQLLRTNPLKAENSFRLAAGFSPIIHKEDDYRKLLEERKTSVGRNLSISYTPPLKIIKGALQYLYDDKGNTFVDCVNNVSHVGHCHPVVVRNMQKQIATLNTNTRYLHEAIVEYAEELTKTLPSNLSVCYFTNSGSEANDLAIRMSRHFTRQEDIIVLDHAYHGTSTTAIEMSPYKFDGKGGFPQKSYIHKAISPDMYRGKYQYGDTEAGKKYAQSIQEIIEQLQANNKGVAAFICETLLGVGGQIPLPANYLKEVYAAVRKAGGICIADEVQVGFGRVGEYFWGFELQGVEPDIVVMGKPIGNGHPLAAVVVTNEIAASFNNGMEYFNTFGGNPVSMVAGLAVLEVIKKEQLKENALETGNYLLSLLHKLRDQHPIIGDVRGHGLFVGVELVKDRISKEPATEESSLIVEEMKNRGFLLSTDGPFHNVLKLKPPLIFNKRNAEEMVKALEDVLGVRF